jgi:hypothetical protein
VAVFVMGLLIVVLAVLLAFAGSQIVTYRAQLAEHAVIADFTQRKELLLEELKSIEGKTAGLQGKIGEHERRVAASAKDCEQKLAAHTKDYELGPGERALDLQQAAERLAVNVQEQERKLEELRKDLESVEEAREIQSFGLYRPRYSLSTSGEYETRLDAERDRQKELIKSEKAAHCPTNWSVDGSAAKGKKMIGEHAKLMLRAFNGECDAAIAKVKFSNVTSMENRLKKSFEAINKLGQSKSIEMITQEYYASKLEELHLVHEQQEKIHAERMEQRAIKEQMRDEERAEKEIEEAQAKAERDASMREEALEKARRELLEASGKQHEKLEALVTKLEVELKDAIDRKAKAIARAQLTKSGHVYVISNLGSFGDGCYKIGLTRRLDPMERVWELGDASVPFEFDVHAMIFSENAPELEGALHRHFAERRVNKVNTRKEFFRVSLAEIQEAVQKLHGVITFVTVPEAEDYRKTLAMELESKTAPATAQVKLTLPA